MNKLTVDTNPLYWMGKSINSMSMEDLQQALRDANIIIENNRKTIYKLRYELIRNDL